MVTCDYVDVLRGKSIRASPPGQRAFPSASSLPQPKRFAVTQRGIVFHVDACAASARGAWRGHSRQDRQPRLLVHDLQQVVGHAQEQWRRAGNSILLDLLDEVVVESDEVGRIIESQGARPNLRDLVVVHRNGIELSLVSEGILSNEIDAVVVEQDIDNIPASTSKSTLGNLLDLILIRNEES